MAPASGMLANNRRPSNGADSTLRMLGAAAAAAGAGAGVGSVDRPCMRHWVRQVWPLQTRIYVHCTYNVHDSRPTTQRVNRLPSSANLDPRIEGLLSSSRMAAAISSGCSCATECVAPSSTRTAAPLPGKEGAMAWR